MECIKPEIGNLITLYEFNELSDKQKQEFEEHLLECDYCFQSLYSLAPVVEKMREKPGLFLARFRQRDSVWEKLKKMFLEFTRETIEFFLSIPAIVKILFPVVAAAVVLLLVFLQTSDNLSDLARVEPVPYHPLKIRGEILTGDVNQLFEDGMQAYTQGNYSEAIKKLELAIHQDSNDVKLHFYSGLCYLLLDKVDPAIKHLQRTIDSGDNIFQEKAYWYLGNAWLLKQNAKSALTKFEKVTELEGDYEWRAREMIEKIKKHGQ